MLWFNLAVIAIETLCALLFVGNFAEKRAGGIANAGKFLLFTFLSVGIVYALQEHWLVKLLVYCIFYTVMQSWYFRLRAFRAAALSLVYLVMMYLMDYGGYLTLQFLFAGSRLDLYAVAMVSKGVLLVCVLLLHGKAPGTGEVRLGKRELLYLLLFAVGSIGMMLLVMKSPAFWLTDGSRMNGTGFAVGFGLIGMILLIYYALYDSCRMNRRLYEERLCRVQAEEKMAQLKLQRAWVHDYREQMQYEMRLLREGRSEEAMAHMEKLYGTFEQLTTAFETGNPVADRVFNAKYAEAKKQGIVLIPQLGDLSALRMETVDLVALLANLLDNAIAAAAVCAEGERRIWFQFEERDGQFLLLVQNTCVRQPRQEQGRFLTSKADKRLHGVGLQNVRRIVERYQGECVITGEGNLFRVSILLENGC